MYGSEYQYAESRLAGTIVRYRGLPVMIDYISYDDGTTAIRNLITGKRKNVTLDKLNVEPAPLGYCNYNGVASYLSRIPMREDWRQGLRKRIINSSASPVAMIDYSEIAKTIIGEFPSYTQCLAITSGSMAWHRDWARDSEGVLYYKSYIVGKKELLNDDFKYLQEELDISMGVKNGDNCQAA